ncbi:MAG: hypothetical protein GY801_10640 [bacterium]|nr:hypothetical protein [bacterium]
MQTSVIQQIIGHFISAFQQLGVQVSLHEIESLAATVHKLMTVPARSYHTPEHILHLANCSAPLQSLAALFHDIVYYQVDRGFSPEVAELIGAYITEQDGETRIREDIDTHEMSGMLTLEVFGFSPGQILSPFNGQNEFLSALFMNRKLDAILPIKLLAKTTAHIEATIPFRAGMSQGLPWMLVLKKRLETLSPKFQVSFSPKELEEIICSTVQFSNRDVDSFSDPDIGTFLSGTWKLLLEGNSSLRFEKVYSVRDYRQALQKMEYFFIGLSPENIFHCYRNTPPPEEFQQLQNIARRNVALAREYLGIKLLAIGIVEALAEVTGGDAPLSLFMGDLKQEGQLQTERLKNFLPVENDSSATRVNSPLLSILEVGRSRESSFDIKNSPISLFLYKRLAPETMQQLFTRTQEMFLGSINAQEFLAGIEVSVVAGIASTCAEMAVTRRDELLRYARSPENSE